MLACNIVKLGLSACRSESDSLRARARVHGTVSVFDISRGKFRQNTLGRSVDALQFGWTD